MSLTQNFFCNHCGKKNKTSDLTEESIGKRLKIGCYNCKRINHIFIAPSSKSGRGWGWTIVGFIIGFFILSYFGFFGSEGTNQENYYFPPEASDYSSIVPPNDYTLPSRPTLIPNAQIPSSSDGKSWKNKLCPKVEPSYTLVRNQAVSIASKKRGSWNVNQLVALYTWMQNNIGYVNDPAGEEYFARASETLALGGGDCEDQSILFSSMVQSIGGASNLVVIPECGHAFASVFLSENKSDVDDIIDDIYQIYYSDYGLSIPGSVSYYTDSSGYWLIVDPTGGQYLGDLLPECKGYSFYPIDC